MGTFVPLGGSGLLTTKGALAREYFQARGGVIAIGVSLSNFISNRGAKVYRFSGYFSALKVMRQTKEGEVRCARGKRLLLRGRFMNASM